MSAADVRSILDAAANQILAVVAPLTARLVRAHVTLDETADTAATDGIHIWVPPVFAGVDVTQDTPVAIGLLVHELGHFLQPLKALEEAETAHRRAALARQHHRRHRTRSHDGRSVPAAGRYPAKPCGWPSSRRTWPTTAGACGKAAASRPSPVRSPWPAASATRSCPSTSTHAGIARCCSAPCAPSPSQTVTDRALQFAWRLAGAADIPPAEVPAYVEETIGQFPELRTAPATFPVPGGSVAVQGAAGQAVQGEACGNVGAHPPAEVTPVVAVRHYRQQPLAAAAQAALGLRAHFHVARGATEIAAPGRLDRRGAGTWGARPPAHAAAGERSSPAQGRDLRRQIRLHERQ